MMEKASAIDNEVSLIFLFYNGNGYHLRMVFSFITILKWKSKAVTFCNYMVLK